MNLKVRTKSVDMPANVTSAVLGSQIAVPTIDKIDSHSLGNMQAGIALPSRMQFTLDNSSDTASSKAFKIFDSVGAVSNLKSLSGSTAGTPQVLTHAILIDYIQARPIFIKGIKVQSTSSSTQLNNLLYYYRADLDGTCLEKFFNLDDAIDGSKYDEKIQSYSFPYGLMIDLMTCFAVTVNASEKVYITFYLWKDILRTRG